MATSMSELRILLVAEQEELYNEIRTLLGTAQPDALLAWVSQPDLAMARSEEFMPSVVLVDHGLGLGRATKVIRQLATRMPGVPILFLVQVEDLGVASQAMLAGARTFVCKPLRAGDLLETLQQALQGTSGARGEAGIEGESEGRIIAFAAPRGGTGRTSLAVNTALGLRLASSEPVVIMDADFGSPAIDVALNLHPEHDLTSLLPRLGQLDAELLEVLLTKHASGLHVLTSPPPGSLPGPLTLLQVEQLLVALRRAYRWVIVDMGTEMDDSAFAFLDSADRIVVNTVPELVSLRNMRWLLDAFATRGYRAEKIWVVINRATMNGAIAPAEIEKRFHTTVRYRVPDDQAWALHSLNRGVPAILGSKNGALVRAYREFAQAILQDLGTVSAPSK